MPISPNVLTPRQAELGKIKIGRRSDKKHEARGSGRAYSPPQKLETKDGPYFLITKTIRDQSGSENFVVDTALMKVLEQFQDKDKHLRRIPIMLDSDDIEEVFPTALTFYRGTKLWCWGTGAGDDAATRYDREQPRKVHCPCEWLSATGDQGQCKPGGTLWCTILAGPDTVIGMRHAFRTHSWNSLRALQGGLLAVHRIVGAVCGVKLWLTVKHHLTKRRDGTWTKVPLVSVMIHADDIPGAQRNVIATTQRRLAVLQVAANPAVLGLPAPGQGETPQQQEEAAAEWFHPGPSAASEPEDEPEEEVIDYDPITGELKDPNAEPEPESRRSTQPALTAATDVYDSAGGGAPAGRPWAKDHPGRARLGQVLRRLAVLRGIEIEDSDRWGAVSRELVAEATDRLFQRAILFGNLTPSQAEAIDADVLVEIERREKEENGEDEEHGDGKDDDDVPYG